MALHQPVAANDGGLRETGAARLGLDAHRVVHLLELDLVQALALGPGGNRRFTIDRLLVHMDGAKHLVVHLAELAHRFERIEQALLRDHVVAERGGHPGQHHVGR